jgi:hypothetical protein
MVVFRPPDVSFRAATAARNRVGVFIALTLSNGDQSIHTYCAGRFLQYPVPELRVLRHNAYFNNKL